MNKPIPFEGIGFLTTALYLLTILLDFDVALSPDANTRYQGIEKAYFDVQSTT